MPMPMPDLKKAMPVVKGSGGKPSHASKGSKKTYNKAAIHSAVKNVS